MAEYINKVEAICAFGFTWDDITPTMEEFIDFLKTRPTADVAPVVHGRWVAHTMIPGFADCSVCKDVYVDAKWLEDGKWRYCPNCGARMDGAEDE